MSVFIEICIYAVPYNLLYKFVEIIDYVNILTWFSVRNKCSECCKSSFLDLLNKEWY